MNLLQQVPDHSTESNVRVLVRVRPLMQHESLHTMDLLRVNQYQNSITMNLPSKFSDNIQGQQSNTSTYNFTTVLGPDSTQEDVFEFGKINEMVNRVIQGFNSTIFAYGQTGSGKTWSMEGHSYRQEKKEIKPVFDETPPEQYGVTIRCMEYLFYLINESMNEIMPETGLKSTKSFIVRCSFCQIYNENVYDLLAPETGRLASLKVRWDSRKDFYVENLYTYECKSAKDALRLFRQGILRRVVASHKMNSASSRSHCLFTFQVEQVDASIPQDVIVSKLVLVDLAGSEKMSSTGATGLVLHQSIGINKSLFTLRKVIAALANGDQQSNIPIPASARRSSITNGSTLTSPRGLQSHIPYRDSILTRLLKPCLGGNSLTLMIACLSPSDAYTEENISTLNYASLAQRISNIAVINEDPKTRLIRQLRAQVKFLLEQLKHSKQVFVAGSGSSSDLRIQIDDSSTQRNSGPIEDLYTNFKQDTTNTFSNYQKVDNNAAMKELIDDNNQLRWALESQGSIQEQREFEIFIFNRENDELRERIQFLESIVVGEQEDLLESITDPSKWRKGNAVETEDSSELAQENKRLRNILSQTAFELQQVRSDLETLQYNKAIQSVKSVYKPSKLPNNRVDAFAQSLMPAPRKSIHAPLQSPSYKSKVHVAVNNNLKPPQSLQAKNYISPNPNPNFTTKTKIQIPLLYDKHNSQPSSRSITPQGSSRNKTLLSPNQLRDLLTPKYNSPSPYSNNPTPRTPVGSQMVHGTLRDHSRDSINPYYDSQESRRSVENRNINYLDLDLETLIQERANLNY